jgi:mercuric ion transport protein
MDENVAGPSPASVGKALAAGGLAAMFASACCLGPLVLVLLGISGAWISSLVALEAYQPLFVTASALSLFYAGRQIWRAPVSCAAGQFCASPRVSRIYKIAFGCIVVLLIAGLAFPLIAPLFY